MGIKNKDKVFRKAKINLSNIKYRENLNITGNEVNMLIDVTKNKFYYIRFITLKGKIKEVWAFMNNILGRKFKPKLDKTMKKTPSRYGL